MQPSSRSPPQPTWLVPRLTASAVAAVRPRLAALAGAAIGCALAFPHDARSFTAAALLSTAGLTATSLLASVRGRRELALLQREDCLAEVLAAALLWPARRAAWAAASAALVTAAAVFALGTTGPRAATSALIASFCVFGFEHALVSARIARRLASVHGRRDLSEALGSPLVAAAASRLRRLESCLLVGFWLVVMAAQAFVAWSADRPGAPTSRTLLAVEILAVAALVLLARLCFFRGRLSSLFAGLQARDLRTRLAAARTEADRNRHLGEMSALIVHDLNGPLHTVRFCLDQLREDPGLIQNPRYLQRLASSGERSLALVASLRLHLKGAAAPAREGASVGDAFAASRGLVDARFASASDPRARDSAYGRIAFILQPEAAALRLALSTDDLVHVFSNLFANSVENLLTHGADGREPRVVVALLRLDEHRAVLAIRDNGTGLDAAAFEALTAHTPSQMNDRGELSVGLRLVRRLVERRGGDLAIERDAGPGTSLLLTLGRA